MPTLQQARDAVDNWVSARWSTVVARQETYASNHGGRYWQGLLTHSVFPAWTTVLDGSVAPDLLARKPTDLASSWLDVLPEWLTELMPASVRVDSYRGALGDGWVLTAFVTFNGNLYVRIVNVGPETFRSKAWHLVTPPIV